MKGKGDEKMQGAFPECATPWHGVIGDHALHTNTNDVNIVTVIASPKGAEISFLF
jgi:hypothetical protein